DGEFSIKNVKNGTKLQITSVGYKPVAVVWNGTPLDIDMELNTQQLDEVVVTAMGIQREAKTLTYAAQTIKSDEVTRIKETNFVNALQGKSAGLTITPNNSGAGGGASKIVLRGSTSILGTNQPLIVLDGVPMQTNQGTQQGVDGIINGGGNSGDDILSTINPEDIENMTILKGPNAAALYGSAANNGVIVITTKSGSAGEAKIDISSSTSIDRIAMYPAIQTRYGATSQLLTGESSVLGAWGPVIGTRPADQVASKPYMLNSARNGIADFFETGVTTNNGVTLTGGNEFSRTYFSYNNTYQKGVMQNNKFMRHNVMLKESFSLFNKRLNISASLNWIHQKTNNPPNTGKTLSALHALYRMPADVDVRYFKNHYQHPGTMNDIIVTDPEEGNIKLLGQPVQTWDWFDKSLNNPYWVTNMYNKETKRNRLLGNLTADVAIWQNIKYQTRLSVDVLMDESQNETWAGMYDAGWLTTGGSYSSGNSYSSDIYNDHMVTWNDRFNDKFDVNVAVGGSFSRHYDRSKSVGVYIDTVGVPNAFTVSNSYRWVKAPDGSLIKVSSPAASDSWGYKDWSAALFATVSVGLYDKIYLDGSYRLEWAQSFQQFTQGTGYKSFDYYSAGANVLIDKFLPRVDWLDQLKWRGSYSVVGNPIPNTLFARQTLNFGTGAISSRPPTFENPRPETTTSFETGIDMWMFNNKFNVDLTYYNSTLKNQFMYITTASGESKPVNTGKIRNYGFEFSAG
ncbi:MAG: SusC/RagA family TonB-linked outer membrane protein, partial [Paramuribaculum sp.]|nr:SusC/RagA family TonB-linked outer membrane protein [Paramuribaculum sp.]